MQDHHPIAYMSKALGVKAQQLSTYEKECLAVIMAFTRWKPYLQYKEFCILTNQRSLVHLGEQTLHEGLQQKAFIKLLGLMPCLDSVIPLKFWPSLSVHQNGWRL